MWTSTLSRSDQRGSNEAETAWQHSEKTKRAFSEQKLLEPGRLSVGAGQITRYRLALSLLQSLGKSRTEIIAGILREFNRVHGEQRCG